MQSNVSNAPNKNGLGVPSDCPALCIVVPCYNEQAVLPQTAPLFSNMVHSLMSENLISKASSVLFVDDGSSDSTWQIISELHLQNDVFQGIRLSRNRGHQNALLAGLMSVRNVYDVTVSIDCDGQDDIGAIKDMLLRYTQGYDVVYGVRSKRETDSFLKRFTAETFYKMLDKMGVESVFNHADYRLMSSRALDSLAQFKEVNLFLRGMVPLVGYSSTIVEYERYERIAGESHYPLGKMIGLALSGITSLSIKPIRMITASGLLVFLCSIIGIIWAIVTWIAGQAVSGWASTLCVILLLGGLQLVALGVIGEYVGRTYMEAKHRPRYIIEESTLQGQCQS